MTGQLSDATKKLHEALVKNDIAAVQQACRDGADIKSQVNFCTPLIFAIAIGAEEIVSLLLDHGAKVDAVNNHGWAALLYAAHEGKAAEELARVKGRISISSLINSFVKPEQFDRPMSNTNLLVETPEQTNSALTREDSNQISNKDYLHERAKRHKANGGKVSEAIEYVINDGQHAFKREPMVNMHGNP